MAVSLHRLAGDRAFVLRGLLSAQECRGWIDRVEGLGFGAAPISTMFGERMKLSVRNNTRVIVDSKTGAAALYARLGNAMAELDLHPARLNERLRSPGAAKTSCAPT